MKITRLRTQVVHLPIDPPIPTAILGSIRSADCVLTFLDTDEGITGEGLVFSINNRRLSVIHEMIRQLEDLVVGMDPRIGGSLNARAWKELNFLGYEGVSIVGLAAVDNALWDLRGKAAGLNVAHLIGACRTAQPTYASGGLWLGSSIDALQKVGTAFSGDDDKTEKVEAGKRLFIKVEDADLSALEQGETIKVHCKTTQGDEEDVVCYSVGRNVRIVLGSIVTVLGRPQPGNGRLEVRGDDKVTVTYIDAHTADRKFNQPRVRQIEVVGNAVVSAMDGAFREPLQGVVLGRQLNMQVIDADRDLTDAADTVKAVAALFRQKSQEEIGRILAARPQYVVSTSEFEDVKSRLAAISNRHKVLDEKEGSKPSLRRTSTNDKSGKDDKSADDDRPTLKRREDQKQN